MADTSITDIKAAFLRSQIRQLSVPLQPSTQWRELISDPQEGHLGDKLIQDVIAKVNEKIKQHDRMVYSAQSQRHVAEQIETLHWNHVKIEENDGDIDAVVVQRQADLAMTEAVQELPEEYDDLHLHPDHEVDVGEERRYGHLRDQLLQLSQRRDEARLKLSKYARLQTLLSPYENPQDNVQPNLVTKDGELARELDKMRVLLAKVTARMSEANGAHANSMASRPTGLHDSKKLQKVMELT